MAGEIPGEKKTLNLSLRKEWPHSSSSEKGKNLCVDLGKTSNKNASPLNI